MYGRVSNHEIIIPYLTLFVGSGVRMVWRGRGVIVGVCGEGLDVSAGGVWMLVWVRRRAERSLQGCEIK